MKRILFKGLVVSAVGVWAMCSIVNNWTMPTEWSEYVVRSGDTVCNISIGITPESEDYRNAEYWIEKKNNIEEAKVYPGQTILVPVYE